MGKMTLKLAQEALATLQQEFEHLMNVSDPTDEQKARLESITPDIEKAEALVKEFEVEAEKKAETLGKGKYLVHKDLAERSDLKKFDAAFTKAAKKFPKEEVTILNVKVDAETKAITVVLNAEKAGMRKVIISTDAE